MENPFAQTYCPVCRRPTASTERICVACTESRTLRPTDRGGADSHPTEPEIHLTGRTWQASAFCLLAVLLAQFSWLGWATITNVILHGFGESILQILELCLTGFIPFGLVMADIWAGSSKLTKYGYLAAGYHLFFGCVVLIAHREAINPISHNMLYVFEAGLGLLTLIAMFLYDSQHANENVL